MCPWLICADVPPYPQALGIPFGEKAFSHPHSRGVIYLGLGLDLHPVFQFLEAFLHSGASPSSHRAGKQPVQELLASPSSLHQA